MTSLLTAGSVLLGTALTSTAAGATSLRELRGYANRLDAANEPVEAAVRVIRGQLGLPPPDTS